MNTENNVTQLFFEAARKSPSKTAIVDRDGTKISFVELRDEVLTAAAFYRSKGISKGDRVMVFVPMGIPLYRSILALFHIGAVAVFLDEWVSKERFEVSCRLAQCKALIAPWKLRLLGLLSKEVRRIPTWLSPGFTKNDKAEENDFPTTADDTALITFTTGSTGIPKAADRTHAFLHAQFEALIDKVQPRENETDMPVLPIVLLLNLGTGVTSVIADYNSRKPKTIEPEKIWQQIVANGVNRFAASPFVVEQLAKSNFAGKTPIRFFTGGAPVFPLAAAAMKEGLPGSAIDIIYGSTEAEPISSISADELSKAGAALDNGLPVGIPYHGTKVLIIPVSDEPLKISTEEELLKLSFGAGRLGEITVTGKHVLKHYIDNPAAEKRNKIVTEKATWHRTGDAGFLDANGQLFLCGRCSTLIEDSAGYILAPFLWEGWLQTVKGVRAGTILKTKTGILAIVEADANMHREGIRQQVLARYAFDEVRFVENIPRDPRHFSKVDYERLRQTLQQI